MSERKPSRDYTVDLISTTRTGNKDYLQAKHTLQLFRDLHPTGQITTELLHYQRALTDPDNPKRLSGGVAVVKARVVGDDGSVGEGIKEVRVEDFGDFVAKAETGAIKRALTSAGIGVQFAGSEFDYESESTAEYVAPISDAKPTDKHPTPPQSSKTLAANARAADKPIGAVVDFANMTADPETGEVVSAQELKDAELIIDAEKTGKKAEVMKAWTEINKSKRRTEYLTDRYLKALAATA